jgi:hypothetical protein
MSQIVQPSFGNYSFPRCAEIRVNARELEGTDKKQKVGITLLS